MTRCYCVLWREKKKSFCLHVERELPEHILVLVMSLESSVLFFLIPNEFATKKVIRNTFLNRLPAAITYFFKSLSNISIAWMFHVLHISFIQLRHSHHLESYLSIATPFPIAAFSNSRRNENHVKWHEITIRQCFAIATWNACEKEIQMTQK